MQSRRNLKCVPDQTKGPKKWGGRCILQPREEEVSRPKRHGASLKAGKR